MVITKDRNIDIILNLVLPMLVINNVANVIEIIQSITDVPIYSTLYNYVEAVKDCPKRQDPNVKSLKWAKLVDSDMEYQERLISFFEDNFMAEMTEGRDYQYDENGDLEVALCNRKSSLIAQYKLKTKPMQDYLKTDECKKAYKQPTIIP